MRDWRVIHILRYLIIPTRIVESDTSECSRLRQQIISTPDDIIITSDIFCVQSRLRIGRCYIAGKRRRFTTVKRSKLLVFHSSNFSWLCRKIFNSFSWTYFCPFVMNKLLFFFCSRINI